MTRSELISVFNERGGVVDAADLLGDVPGDGDLEGRVAGDERGR